MEELAATLDEVQRALGEAVTKTFREGDLRAVDDESVLSLVAQAAAVARLVDAVLVEAVGQVQERADAAPRAERITTTHGCRSKKELVQRLTRGSSRSAGELLRAARAVAQPMALTAGESLPAPYPAMRDALADGDLGAEALAVVAATLDAADCAGEARLAADEELAASARGVGSDGGPPPCVDELRMQAQVWAMYLDQDGAEPREARAMRKRGFSLGACRDGSVPVRGNLLPEVAAQLDTIFHAILNPKGDGPEAPAGPQFVDADADVSEGPLASAADTRSRTQRQHDALASILSVAARSGELPTIGGAAPTLVVSVTVDELRSGRGHAHIDGCDEPVSVAAARQVACAGGVQRVITDSTGRIRAIHTLERVFDQYQRRAIALRDGGCVIPGCHVPAAWCEIHHVEEHSRGGPTHTGNGVLLCWHHHRTLDSSGWRVRMRDGLPEVRGPSWWDRSASWRAVTRSPIRMRQRLRARAPSVL
ncbi:HNH endonuclease [Microbacterium sp. LRZ72]|uniref:HNH endonuclease signature motif containing protein n=1 Tax=Microbacterium sp. LRZ72 TaxID=2942481 RepID=UPI0029BD12E3|nr:DUF222 domain-containing protein [Microbacterium sp. LRZ72]MDX2377306.1 HNH endonuclease [Microbacterium sp. LRZ72]